MTRRAARRILDGMKSNNSAAAWFYRTSFAGRVRLYEPKPAACEACARRMTQCFRCADMAAGK